MLDDTISNDPIAKLEPDRSQLETFIRVLFRHAGTEGYVSLRTFDDDGTRSEPTNTTTIKLKDGLDAVIAAAVKDAAKAANSATEKVFSPPIAVFNGQGKDEWRAREEDLL